MRVNHECCLSENHQPRQVPTLSQHDHNHLNSNHAHLVPPNHNLHITTITCQSPLSGLDRHNLRTHLLLQLQVSVIAHLLRSPFRTPARESQPVIFYQISPSDCYMLPATAAPQLPSLGSINLPLLTSFSSCGLHLYCDRRPDLEKIATRWIHNNLTAQPSGFHPSHQRSTHPAHYCRHICLCQSHGPTYYFFRRHGEL